MQRELERDWTHFAFARDQADLQLLYANFRKQRFQPHTHDCYSVGVIETGTLASIWGGGKIAATPGEISAINPGTVHSGYPIDNNGWRYRNFFIGESVVRHLLADLSAGVDSLPMFVEPVIRDAQLARYLGRLHEALMGNNDPLYLDCFSLDVLTRLFQRHSNRRLIYSRKIADQSAIEKVKSFIEERFDKDCRLKVLAEVARLSPHYLLRTFKQKMGMTPYAFLTQTRVYRAQEYLKSGASIAETSDRCGFADQSHLTRRFKQVLGITPGTFLRALRR